jgi:hypothetical protein
MRLLTSTYDLTMSHAEGPRRVDTMLWSGITKVHASLHSIDPHQLSASSLSRLAVRSLPNRSPRRRWTARCPRPSSRKARCSTRSEPSGLPRFGPFPFAHRASHLHTTPPTRFTAADAAARLISTPLWRRPPPPRPRRAARGLRTDEGGESDKENQDGRM